MFAPPIPDGLVVVCVLVLTRSFVKQLHKLKTEEGGKVESKKLDCPKSWTKCTKVLQISFALPPAPVVFATCSVSFCRCLSPVSYTDCPETSVLYHTTSGDVGFSFSLFFSFQTAFKKIRLGRRTIELSYVLGGRDLLGL